MYLSLLGSTTTGWDAVTDGVGNVITLATTMLTTILSNAVLATCFAIGFVGIGIGIVKRLKRA